MTKHTPATEAEGEKTAEAAAAVEQAAATSDEAATVTEEQPAPSDPETAGMDALTARGLDPLKLWTVKSPKGMAGTISGVFLQATSAVVILQQLASGRFVLFGKMDVPE